MTSLRFGSEELCGRVLYAWRMKDGKPANVWKPGGRKKKRG